MRTNRSVVGRPSDIRWGRQTKGREHTARGKGSFGLLIVTAVLGLLAVAVLATPTPAFAAGVTVTVTPSPVQVVTGSSVQLDVAVAGTGDMLTVWSLSGPGCSGMSCGTINFNGQYTAPSSRPNPPTVFATATSLADSSASGSAEITIVAPAPVAITLTPPAASVAPGAEQQLTATVTGTKNTAVNWNIVGAGCFGFQCGLISPGGLYIAPPQIPNPPSITVTATAQADSTKSASSTLVIGSGITVAVLPANPQVLLGQGQAFSATVTGTNNTAVTWSVSGAGCSGATCGTIDQNGNYTAPANMPSPASVVVTATSAANTNSNGASTVTLVPANGVTVQPGSIHVLAKGTQQFFATVVGSLNQSVIWTMSGAGCAGASCGNLSASGVYTAPAVIPSPNVVTIKATSVALPKLSGTGTVFIGAASPVKISLTPTTANVIVGKTQQFTAKVTGTDNTAVTWNVVGGGCGAVGCGTISATGLYTAPATPPVIPEVEIVAVSVFDPTQTASSIVTITPSVTVTVNPPSATVADSGKQQFTAVVTGVANTAVTWSVSGKGCGGVACGTITTGGLYTAPAVTPNPPVVTVTATSQAIPTVFGTAGVAVGAAIKVTVAPATVNVAVSGQQKFVATVVGAANTAVTWSVSGASCPNACGSIDGTGLYTAPATVPNSTVKVTATSQANGVSAGSATVTVIDKNEGKLKGQYAFLFRGKDANGFYQAAGSFIANGAGGISAGIEDISRTSGVLTAVAFTGSYSVGGDDRGVLTITNAHGTFTYTFALTGNGAKARMIEADGTGIRGTGIMALQNSMAFSTFGVSGGYAISLEGADSAGSRLGALGAIFPSGAGFVSGSALDVNDGGQELATVTGFSGSYTVAANGRGTMTLSISGFAGGKFDFTIYVISTSEFFMLSTDALSGLNPLFSGTALLQTGSPYSNSSFNGNSTFYETGVTNRAPDISVGLMTFNGTGNVSVGYDVNAGGQVQIANGAAGRYSVAGDGRTQVNLVNSQTQQNSTLILYMISPNTAFLMDTSGSVRIGYMENMVVEPRFGDSDLAGHYTVASASAAGSATPLVTGVATFDGNGDVAGDEDLDLAAATSLNQILNGTYGIAPSSPNGRGNILLTLPQAETVGVWLATYTRAYGIPVDAGDATPTVLIFEQ